jgi:hypothetical protein
MAEENRSNSRKRSSKIPTLSRIVPITFLRLRLATWYPSRVQWERPGCLLPAAVDGH